MFGWLAKALAFFYQVWPSYAGAIILLTLAIMIVLLPLTLKGTRSMLEMQRLQPEMKRLQAKYKDDRQKLNEEILALYREHNVNPVGGCLPMLLQLPVFWVLYRVLEGLTHRAPMGLDVGAALTGNPHAIAAAGHFQPSYISNTSELYKALHGTGRMMSLGIDLSESVTTAFRKGFAHTAPFIVLLVLVIVTTYVQQWQMQARTPRDQINPQQQMMMKLMPVMFAFIYFFIPAGVVLYFLASNLFRIGQQYFITRTMFPAVEGAAAGAAAGERRGWRAMLPSGSSLPQLGRARPNKGRQTARPAQTARRGGGAVSGRPKRGSGPKPTKAAPSPPAGAGRTARTGKQGSSQRGTPSNGRTSAPSRKGPPPPRASSKKKRK